MCENDNYLTGFIREVVNCVSIQEQKLYMFEFLPVAFIAIGDRRINEGFQNMQFRQNFAGECNMRSIFFAIMIFLLVPTHAYSWVVKSDFEGGVLLAKLQMARSQTRTHRELILRINIRFILILMRIRVSSQQRPCYRKEVMAVTWGLVWKFPKCTEGKEFWYRAWINFRATLCTPQNMEQKG